jgi:hypothetical protein
MGADINAHPPVTQRTERFALCEWAARVMPRLAEVEYISFELSVTLESIARLYRYADSIHTPSAQSLISCIDEFEACVLCAEIIDGRVLVPVETVVPLAAQVLRHASH